MSQPFTTADNPPCHLGLNITSCSVHTSNHLHHKPFPAACLPPTLFTMASDDTDTATPHKDHQITAPGQDTTVSSCESFANTDAEASNSLSRLPAEIRLMVWQQLLPGRRVFSVRTTNGSDPQSGRLRFEGQPRQPILSQICQESRDFILRQGAFIFKNGGDGGFWWSTEDDVLLLDYHCALGPLSYALESLDGLKMIQNIAVDSYQAVAFRWYKQEPRHPETGTATVDSEGAHTVRWMLSWGKALDCPSYRHPILRFFSHARRLTVHFAQPFHDPPHSGPSSCDLLGDCSCTIDIPAEDMEAAIGDFKDFHEKWKNLSGGSDSLGLPCRFRWRQSTVYQFSPQTREPIEFCRKSSFVDDGDYITREWACSHRMIWVLHHYRVRKRNRSAN